MSFSTYKYKNVDDEVADLVVTSSLKTPLIKPPSDSTTAIQIMKADGTTPVINVDTTNQQLKLAQIGANADAYNTQKSSGILSLESSQWTGSAEAKGNWTVQSIPSTTSNVAILTTKYSTTTILTLTSAGLFTNNLGKIRTQFSSTTTTSPTSFFQIKNTSTVVGNYASLMNINAGNMNTGFLAFKNVSHHASTGSADFSVWLASGAAAAERFTVTNLNNVICGSQAAIATNATDGFLYVPSCAGQPTGTPTAYTGKVAVVADSTNNKLYIYSGGGWVALN
jgi:hypothetical protein